MLKIEDNAFKNCLSLKELHFEKFDDVQDFKSRFNDGMSNDYSIIVKDKLCIEWIGSNFETHVVPASRYIQQQIDKFKKPQILTAISLLSYVESILADSDYITFLNNIVHILQQKYAIKKNVADEVKILVLSKLDYKIEDAIANY